MRNGRDVRKALVRRHMLQQRQANLSKFVRGLWLEAFRLEVLWMCQRALY